MTTKPKARKFRIRRTSLLGSSAAVADDHAAEEDEIEEQEEEHPPVAVARPVTGPAVPPPSATARPVPGPETSPRPAAPGPAADTPADDDLREGDVASAAETAGETDMETIRREGLTGRQLRMARRVAQKYNLPATSDFDAVRLLRERGIDPFARSNMLELVVPQGAADAPEGSPDAFAQVAAAAGQLQVANRRGDLPQTAPQTNPYLPGPEMTPAQRRERDIGAIQRDIMLRRRKRLVLLLTRLAFFVMLPTIICGWYFYQVASPMYSSKSEFLILQADNLGGAGLGGLLSGTQFATSQDSIATQSYLQSKDAMLRLDADVGFKSHFSQDWIDPIQRLNPNASNEEAYRTYSRNVKIGYDPTEGVIRMEVAAADPEVAREFSAKLISYAEQRINHLSEQKRADQMKDAKQGFAEAETARRAAQEALVSLQQQGALLDPEAVIATLRAQINNIELQLQDKELQLAALLDNARPNQARVDGARADVERLRKLLGDLNGRMLDVSKGENSLAELTVRIEMARADLATRDLMLQSALQQVEQTRMEANRQVRYLTTSVQPVASQEPSYPRKFENTILAFLIFSGIYLMLSLTASILREQVTS